MQDTVCHEDTCQVRIGHDTYVMARLCNPAITIVRQTGDTNTTVTLRVLDYEPETVRRLTGLRESHVPRHLRVGPWVE